MSAPAAALTADGDTLAEKRPITSTYTLEGGYAENLETYLSPLRYKGGAIAVGGNWRKAFPGAPQSMEMEMNASIGGSFTRNPAGNARMYGVSVSYDWGLTRCWDVAAGWRVGAGAALGTELGALYLPRNGNNPATAKADVMLSLRGRAEWTTRIGRLPVRFAECVFLPSVGAMFSPGYGESYYEIYLGNTSGLVHPAWWGNHFCIDNLLSAELATGSRRLTVGYRLKVGSSWVNNLNSRQISHSIVVGVTLGGNDERRMKR